MISACFGERRVLFAVAGSRFVYEHLNESRLLFEAKISHKMNGVLGINH